MGGDYFPFRQDAMFTRRRGVAEKNEMRLSRESGKQSQYRQAQLAGLIAMSVAKNSPRLPVNEKNLPIMGRWRPERLTEGLGRDVATPPPMRGAPPHVGEDWGLNP